MSFPAWFKNSKWRINAISILGMAAVVWLWRMPPALLACLAPCFFAVAVAWVMFRASDEADPERTDSKDIGKTCGVIALSLAGDFYAVYAAVAYVNFSNRIAGILAVEMWSLATYAFGFGIGFLFGIPRVLQRDVLTPNDYTDRDNYIQRVNTNLEQISDWLIKIIVGLGLVQLQQIPGFLKRVSFWAASCLPLQNQTGLVPGSVLRHRIPRLFQRHWFSIRIPVDTTVSRRRISTRRSAASPQDRNAGRRQRS